MFTLLGKYRQATVEVQQHIEDLQHDLAIVGQIAGLAASLRGKHEVCENMWLYVNYVIVYELAWKRDVMWWDRVGYDRME